MSSTTQPSTAPSRQAIGTEKSTTEQKQVGATGRTSIQQGQGEGKPKRKRASLKGKRKGKPGKIHIRLPPIEAYQKDLCFAAEAPGRVVVRLERLMGSDKIRPVDGKYMDTLIQRLEEEEKIAWDRKIWLRKQAEKERHRQLAINGLMEPGPGMEDLYNHPVFRVNRILNRLSSLDSSFSNNPALKFPPIVQIDPFEKDETGGFFKEYPAHRALRKEWEMYKDKYPKMKTEKEPSIQVESKQKQTDEGDSSNKAESSTEETISAKSEPSKMPKVSPPSDLEEEDEYDEELLEEEEGEIEEEDPVTENPAKLTAAKESKSTERSEMEQLTYDLNREYMDSLEALQDKYEIPQYDGFEDEWKPYRCQMVEKFCAFEEAGDMYGAARDLFELYTRQALVTQSHVKKTLVKNDPSKVKGENGKQTKSPKSTVENASDEIEQSVDEFGEHPTENEEETIRNQLLGIEKEAVSKVPMEGEESKEGKESQMDDVPDLIPAESGVADVNDTGESENVLPEMTDEEGSEATSDAPVDTDQEEEEQG